MRTEEGHAWRPSIPGWSNDILPYYERIARELPPNAQCVEVGVAWGRSTIFLAGQLLLRKKPGARIWAVDAWDPTWWRAYPPGQRRCLATLVQNATAAELDLIHVIRTTSERAARIFLAGELDFVFVDGDHTYESVSRDLDAWRGKVRPGGILAGHDYAARWPGVVQAVNAIFPRRDIVVEETIWWTRVTS
jgi:cephalosporin hydroxylase